MRFYGVTYDQNRLLLGIKASDSVKSSVGRCGIVATDEDGNFECWPVVVS